MPAAKTLPFGLRSLDHAVALGAALIDRAAETGDAWAAVSRVDARAVVLGAGQRAGRVVDLAACRAAGVRVVRRVTAGTAASIAGRSLWIALALPGVAALSPDATPRTLINRNVRPLLEGLRAIGVPAAYFGREHVAIAKRPGPLLGFEARPDGAVLIEVLVGWDAPVSVPPALAAPAERAVDRLRGKEPAALGELARGRDVDDVGRHLLAAIVAPAASREEVADDVAPAPLPDLDDDDPVPRGLALAAPRACPIGWVDAAASLAPRRAWVGGDGLVPAYVRAAVAEHVASGAPLVLGAAPIDGLALADLVEACEAALA